MKGCVFCKILEKDIPSEKIYEHGNIYGFLDVRPINRGHTLIIHKHHHTDIFDTPEKDMEELIVAAKHVATAVNKAMKADGVNIGMNNKAAAGQAVLHAHLHVIPRFERDGLKHWPGKSYSPEELKIDAELIKKEL